MIKCGDYDYIELVCTYRYPVRLTLKSGDVVEGTALDTKRNNDREECIKIDASGTESLVLLDSIAKLEVSVENPHFKAFIFS